MRQLALVFACAAALSAAALDRQGVEFSRPGGKPQYLDLHVPDGPGPFPAAILVHGGGFDEGSRSTNVRPLFQPLADAGFAWFSIDYRMAPEFRLPQAIADVNEAVRWVKRNAATYRVDPAKIALIGESAGGYLVNYAATHEGPAAHVAAVVDFYGPVDYSQLVRERKEHPERFNMASIQRHMAHGGSVRFLDVDDSRLHEVSPLAAVHRGMPPFLCIHGNKDDQVAYPQSVEFCEALRQAGVPCELVTIQNGGHGIPSWRAPDQQHWKAEMIAWLKKTL